MRKNSGIVFVPGNERQGQLPLAGRGVKDHARYHAALAERGAQFQSCACHEAA
jgi:hypothetical protein